ARGWRWSRGRLDAWVADAMAAAGFPLDQRGSRAELARRSGVDQALVSNVFLRDPYVPQLKTRRALGAALGLEPEVVDQAAAEALRR
ncbi:hypothetical protein ACWGQ5_53995, partial [Streptomyces sp. NPDC055722]